MNASEWHYTGREREIRLGFMQIKGLRREVVERLVEERTRGGAFRSLVDVLDRVRLDAHCRASQTLDQLEK